MPALNPLLHLNNIWCMDVLKFLRLCPSESIHLFVTSPPYNLRNSTGNGMQDSKSVNSIWNAKLIKGYDDYEDKMPHDEYIAWQREVVGEMFRCIPNDGAIFYNHKWRVQDGLFQRLSEDITKGFPVRQILIWDRGSGMNFSKYHFTSSYEVVYVICKPKFELRASQLEALKDRDVWRINFENDRTYGHYPDHPAPFPLEFALRAIRSTYASIVADPFMGRGTTARACQILKRNYIGCDQSQEYVKIAKKWLSNTHQEELF